MVTETRWAELPGGGSRVVTHYAIGHPWFMAWIVPIVRWTFKRNHRALMKGDLSMRARKSELRRWGYSFKTDAAGHPFRTNQDLRRPKDLTRETTGDFPHTAN